MVVHSPMRSAINGLHWLYMIMLVCAIGSVSCSGDSGREVLRFEAELGGQSVAMSSPTNPVELHHQQITMLTIDVINVSDEPATIAHVRLEGQLLDLIFLTYDTGIHETVQPGEHRLITFPLDFFDLKGQTHGLLRSRLTLFDAERTALGHQDLVIDGRGSPFATTSVFNAVLAAVTLASLGWNLFRLSQRRLPVNRFARGLRFVHTGIGAGLTIAAACSTLRIWPLSTISWMLVTIGAALIGFGAGYLSPGSESDIDELLIDLVEEELSITAIPIAQSQVEDLQLEGLQVEGLEVEGRQVEGLEAEGLGTET